MALSFQTIRRSTAALVLCLGLAGHGHAQAISMNIPVDKTHRQISVVVAKGLTSTAKLPTPALRAARKAMLDGKEITPEDLRALADHGDGLAALKYHRYLAKAAKDAGTPDANASDIAFYGMIALGTGRVWPLPDVIDALRKLDPATEPAARKKAYVATLYPYAWAGNSLALDAVIELNGPGKLFGEMSKATQDRISKEAEKADGDGRLALRLALMLVQNPDRSKADLDLAQHFLKLAKASSNLQVQTTATNLADLLASGGPVVIKE